MIGTLTREQIVQEIRCNEGYTAELIRKLEQMDACEYPKLKAGTVPSRALTAIIERREMSLREVMETCQAHETTVSVALQMLTRMGLIERVRKGTYRAVDERACG